MWHPGQRSNEASLRSGKRCSAQRFGARGNCFDLSGHSLRLIQVHSKLQIVLNKDISIVELSNASFFDFTPKEMETAATMMQVMRFVHLVARK